MVDRRDTSGELASRSLRVQVVPWLLALNLAVSAHAQVTYRTVALEGEDAPGTGNIFGQNLQQYAGFGLAQNAPGIDADGGVGFFAMLSGSTTTDNNNTGLWIKPAVGTSELVAREGNAAIPPGGLAGFDTFLTSNAYNPAGQFAFRAFIAGADVPAHRDEGLWSGDAGGLALVAREGDRPPGLPAGSTFSLLRAPLMNPAGLTAFQAVVGGNNGIWSQRGGPLGLVAYEGDAAPGFPPAVTFTTLSHPEGFNHSGTTVFRATLDGPGVSGASRETLWSDAGGTPALVARGGDPAPDPGTTFLDFDSARINDADAIVWSGFLAGPGATAANNAGVFLNAGGTTRTVARKGDPAPGTASGVVFSQFLNAPLINGSGQTLVNGRLSGTGIDVSNDTGLWLDTAGALDLIVQEGSAAPGLGAGVRIGTIGVSSLNAAGQLAFISGLEGTGIDVSNNMALWAAGPDDELELIARRGDLFRVGASFRRIDRISMAFNSGGQDGRTTALNDVGELAFALEFLPNFGSPLSGIFVATLPSALLGDYNASGLVEQGDLDLVLSNWGAGFAGLPATWVNQRPTSGIVDQAELDGVLTNWGSSSAPDLGGANVPEPAAVWVLAALVPRAIRRRAAH